MTILKENSLHAKAINDYIKEKGFGPQTPALDSSLSEVIFKQHYYDKKTLIQFCQSNGLSTYGLKHELNTRISLFLKTGRVAQSQPKKVKTLKALPDSELGLSLDRRVVNYKSDRLTRDFFKLHIPGFTSFSALVQKWLKERLALGEWLTYRDVIERHKQFLCDKKIAKHQCLPTKTAHDSCQFNQFSIDYRHDLSPKIHSLKDAWLLVRNSAGAKNYQRYKEKIDEIKNLLAVDMNY